MSYDPNQPRDGHGMWTSGSGSGSGATYFSDKYSKVSNEEIANLAKRGQKMAFNNNEKRSLDEYKKDSTFPNLFLRGMLKSPTASEKQEIIDHVRNIDSALAKNSLAESVVVHRSMPSKLLDAISKSSDQVMADMAFVSTTFDRDIAEEYAKESADFSEEYGRRQKFEPVTINVPRGLAAYPMHWHNYYDTINEPTADRELLLKRGLKFKLIEKRKFQVIS